MTLTTRLYTFFNGTLVGTDVASNRYYKTRRPGKGTPEKRWALFRAGRDPSVVSPDWHGWLHHTADTPPNQQHRAHYGWEKPPQANLTGTPGAWLPQGHLQKKAHPAPTLNTYEPWRP